MEVEVFLQDENTEWNMKKMNETLLDNVYNENKCIYKI